MEQQKEHKKRRNLRLAFITSYTPAHWWILRNASKRQRENPEPMQVPRISGLRVCPFTRVIFLGQLMKKGGGGKRKGRFWLTEGMYVSPGDPAS